MAYETFEQLRADRRAYVDIARRNKFEDGLRTVLADLYPDNAHFIYELVQNAEDARATIVEFDLGKSRLTVAHDGALPFSLADVEAITGIGQSPKKDDETQIGKFGVGFKAVYAYTDHPEIRSGEHAFVIRDLFVPDPVSVSPSGNKTIFTFPFDRKEKLPAVAYEEVARGLRELDETTVLFLSSIKTIRYRLPNGAAGEISRSGDKARYISIKHTTAGATEESNWLRLTGNRTISPHIARGQTVAAAFRLDRPLSRRGAKGVARARVVPIDAAQTCIYFPAAKESSGLRFHIHAPFASTVARDSVRDTPENDALVDAIGRLVASALPGLRDDELIEDGLLASLPNAADPLDEPYTSIRDHIREAFWNEEITPVYTAARFSHASFAPAKSLVASPSEFRSGLDTKDLEVLLPLADLDVEGSPQWVAPREGRAGRFLNGLGIKPFGWDEFAMVLATVKVAEEYTLDDDRKLRRAESAEHAAWIRWLTSKDDEHLKAFYELLGLGELEGDLYPFHLQGLELVRVHTKTGVTHLRGAGVFFPPSRQELGDGNRVPLTLAYFEDDKPSKSKNQLEAFYEATGVRHWNERSRVEVRLAAYDNHQQIDEAQHLADMRLFIAHLAEHPADAHIFSGISFLQRRSAQMARPVWGKPSATCVDKPYLSTGLAVLAATTGKLPLSDLYRRRKLSGAAEFAVAVGCVSELTIQKANVWENPQRKPEWYTVGTRHTVQGVKRDWDLPELDVILKKKNQNLLRLLWELLSQTRRDKGDATFQLNGQAPKYLIRSRLYQRLDGTAWVLDRNGRLKKPRAMTAETLPEGWAPPADTSLVMRLGFGEDARNRGAEELGTRRALMKLGMPREMLDEFLASSKEDRQEFFAGFYRKQELKREFPTAGSANPERRAGLVGVDAQNAPEYETVIRERRIAKGAAETKEIARQYLREQYTTQSGEMYCQACHEQMPFKVRGSWYFEAVPFLPERRKQHYQNHLALCPLCAAKYAYVRDTDDTVLLDEVRELEAGAGVGIVSIPVSLYGGRVELKFTGKHAIDLKAVLTAAGEAR